MAAGHGKSQAELARRARYKARVAAMSPEDREARRALRESMGAEAWQAHCVALQQAGERARREEEAARQAARHADEAAEWAAAQAEAEAVRRAAFAAESEAAAARGLGHLLHLREMRRPFHLQDWRTRPPTVDEALLDDALQGEKEERAAALAALADRCEDRGDADGAAMLRALRRPRCLFGQNALGALIGRDEGREDVDAVAVLRAVRRHWCRLQQNGCLRVACDNVHLLVALVAWKRSPLGRHLDGGVRVARAGNHTTAAWLSLGDHIYLAVRSGEEVVYDDARACDHAGSGTAIRFREVAHDEGALPASTRTPGDAWPELSPWVPSRLRVRQLRAWAEARLESYVW